MVRREGGVNHFRMRIVMGDALNNGIRQKTGSDVII